MRDKRSAFTHVGRRPTKCRTFVIVVEVSQGLACAWQNDTRLATRDEASLNCRVINGVKEEQRRNVEVFEDEGDTVVIPSPVEPFRVVLFFSRPCLLFPAIDKPCGKKAWSLVSTIGLGL